ncbi:hypothetical protein J4E81_003473 [Alternaria sp. BMP 2799]|nr:hypothetical protein J4E81_003473 [Alternaria sp. BMP 2799]
MLTCSRRFLPSVRSFATGRTLRLLFAFIGIAIGVNLFVLFDWTYIESLPRDILGKQAFHPKPFAPLPHELNTQADNGLDFWTWNTTTQFKKIKYSEWRDGSTDECTLFPVHLLSKVQVILKTGSADDKSRTDAQLSTIIKCISNVLIVSDGNHTYGRDHRTIDVLADLPPNTYLIPEDYVVYEAQKNASRHGTKLRHGHEGWRLDKTYHSDAQPNVKKQVWFAYGGAGFILSQAAAHRLVDRHRNAFGLKGPRLTTEYKEDIRADCCGDSILGWALHDKAGIDISGLWPMFSPHRLENVPFGEDHWCEPVISLRKTDPALYKDLWSWENEWKAKSDLPMRYRNLLYRALLSALQGEYPQRENWDAAFDAGFQFPDNSTVH